MAGHGLPELWVALGEVDARALRQAKEAPVVNPAREPCNDPRNSGRRQGG